MDREMKTPTDTRSPELISPLNKGLGPMDLALAFDDIPKLGWHLLHEDLSLPTAVLYEDKLTHNLRWMQDFAAAYQVNLAPHGKTTMAPKLFARQLQAGAWGITLATAHQTRVAYEHGVRRVLMANQLVGKQNMAIVARLLEDPKFEYFCLIDSAEQVESLGSFFRGRGQRLNVLVELGVDGGRAGVRNDEQLSALLAALESWREHVALCGVEIYEGILKDEPLVRQFLQRAVEVARELSRVGRFDRAPIILSGAGSAWYDVVADVFSKRRHRATRGSGIAAGLLSDARCWHLSRGPATDSEPQSHRPTYALQSPTGTAAMGVCSICAGERKSHCRPWVSGMLRFDAGLPTPALHYRPGREAPVAAPAHWKLTGMMDQHAYLHITEGDDLRVGDMIGFDISHPCLTFDKWRYLPS